MKYFFPFCLFVFATAISYAQLSGFYTIGGVSPDFNTISTAVSSLQTNGVDGPVTFNIRDGAYNEQIIIPSINGASDTTVITFQSEGLDSSLVWLEYSSVASANNYVIKLDGADYISFRHLSFRQTGTAFGSTIFVMDNGSDHNKFSQCHFIGLNSSTIGNHELIYSSGSSNNSNVFEKNHFENGGAALRLDGTSSIRSHSTLVDLNIIDSCNSGIIMSYNDSVRIQHNRITLTSNSYGKGIKIEYSTGGVLIDANRSVGGNSAAVISVCDSVVVTNNMFTTDAYSSSSTIAVSANDKCYVKHNSALCRGLGNSKVCAITAPLTYMYNNIFCNIGEGTCVVAGPGQIYSDKNNLYSRNGALVTKNSVTYPTLADWQNAPNNPDQNSWCVDALFNSPSDLHLYPFYDWDGTGYSANLAVDFDGDIRGIIPDIGADEFDLSTLDPAGINTHDTIYLDTGMVMLNSRFRNNGLQNIVSAEIYWSVDNVPQPGTVWSGNLSPGDTTQFFSVGNMSVEKDSMYHVRVWTKNPNTIQDTLFRNDTTHIMVGSKMTGTYFVGGSGSHFPDVVTSVRKIVRRTVCGKVEININPGDYQGSFTIPKINGTSSSYTVTWQSTLLDSSSVSIYAPDNDPANRLISLDSAQFVIFKHLTIGDIHNNLSDQLIPLIWSRNNHTSHHIVIDNCHIVGSGSSQKLVFLVDINGLGFTNNLMENNLGGFSLENLGCAQCVDSLVISHNILQKIVLNGMDIKNCKNVHITKNEILFNATVPGAFLYSGVYFEGVESPLNFTSNSIKGTVDRVLTLDNCTGTSSTPINISNNMLGVICRPGSIGAFLRDTDHMNFVHNSIHLSVNPIEPSGIGINVISLDHGDNNKIVNNIFSSEGSNNIIQWTYFSNVTNIVDYNAFYRGSPNFTEFSNYGFIPGPNLFNLVLDPQFVSNTDLHINNPALAGQGWDLGYPEDFDSDTRNSPPTIGADEFPLSNTDVFPLALSTEIVNCDSSKLSISFINFGYNDITSLNSVITYNGIPIDTISWSGLMETYDSTAVYDIIVPTNADSTNLLGVYTTDPNGGPDDNNSNDTVYFSFTYSLPEILNFSDTLLCSGDTLHIDQATIYDHYLWHNGDTLSYVNLTDTGLVSVTITDSLGCMVSDTMFFEYAQGLQLNTINDTLVCPTDTFYATTDSGFSAYLWSNGATAYGSFISDSGTVSVTATDSIGCSETIFFEVDYIQTPVVTPLTDTTTCAIDTLQIQVSAGYETYLWSTGDTTNQISVSDSGHYFVFVFDSLGCYSIGNYYIHHSMPVSVPLSDTMICENDTLQLSVAPGYTSYLWHTGDTTAYLEIADSGSVWISITDSIGCTLLDSGFVTVVPLPAINAIPDTNLCEGDSVTFSANTGYFQYVWSTGDTTNQITLHDSGSVSLVVSDSFGCSSLVSFHISVSPFFLGQLSDTIVCPADTYTFNISSLFNSYIWNTGDTTFNTVAPDSGQYIVQAEDLHGCPVVDSAYLSHYYVPQISLSYNGDTLFANVSGNVEWFLDNTLIPGAIDSFYVASSSGSYFAVFTSSDGCISSSDTLFFAPVSVPVRTNYDLSIYPNPVINTVTVSCPCVIENIEFISADGRTIMLADTPNQNKVTYSVKDIERGLYFVRVRSKNTVIISRILRQ